MFIENENFIKSHIEELASIVEKDKPLYTRRAFTQPYLQSRAWLKNKMIEYGLDVHIDAASNLIGVKKGTNDKLRPIMIGSHTDTVIGGGRFDGIIGVLAGLEIARQLQQHQIELEHTLYIVDFTAEEASEFGISTIGSRGMVGNLPADALDRIKKDGLSLREGLIQLGGKPDQIKDNALKKGDISLYLELHIEQGPVLEQTAFDLGVVTGIVGICRFNVTVNGQANHAGTTPMTMRKDALAAASEVILAIEESVHHSQNEEMVGTVGRLAVQPNFSNVIPGEVVFDFELRSLDEEALNEVIDVIKERITAVESKRGVKIDMDRLSVTESINIGKNIVDGVAKGAEKVAPFKMLPSGAGHDANQIARIAPVGMIFVPSEKGISHSQEEWTDYALVTKGIHALWNTLLYFDQMKSY